MEPVRSAVSQPANGATVTTPPTVLIVDDDENIRELTRLSLERVTGWTVLVADGCNQALEHLSKHIPDAILLDVMMPDFDGPTTLSMMHERGLPESTPVVFLTAKAQSGDHSLLRALPVAGVIPKPFDPMTLGRQLAKLAGWVVPSDGSSVDPENRNAPS